jgi:signal transduction histidine kinase
MSTTLPRSRWPSIALGPDVGILDLAIGLVLAGFGVALVTDAISTPGHHGGVPASLAVLTMTLPVVWRRRYPVTVAAVLAGGAVLNALAIGRMVRCGPALPALLVVAFALGRRNDIRDRRLIALAAACLIGSSAVQGFSDPDIPPVIVVPMTLMIVALFAIGRGVSTHSAVVARLRTTNDELRQRRRQTAELAAQADRARIAEGLNDTLRSLLANLADAAEAGHSAHRRDPASPATREAFAIIERIGRETLRHMRHVVGTLVDEEPPIQPQPDLSHLEQLVTHAGREVSLQVEGRRRELSAGLELSAYRTVEHLLHAFISQSGQQIAITLDFGADMLTLVVRGPAPPIPDQRAAMAASEARVALHNGVLSSTRAEGQWEATARLPLPAHA